MALTQEQRKKAATILSRRWSNNATEIGITKVELFEAVAGFDQAIDDNRSTMNQWIPEPARSNLSFNQKLEMMLRILEASR